MVSELFFSQLALIALLWLCCMRHWVGLSDRPMVPSPLPQPMPTALASPRAAPLGGRHHKTALRPPVPPQATPALRVRRPCMEEGP